MIVQGSKEWLDLRRGKITASKIPVILGISPYQTPRELWEEELGFREPQQAQQHMLDGLAIEDEARRLFKEYCEIEVHPAVIFHRDNPKFMASLDGLSADRKTILEIKKNNIEFHELAKRGKVPEFHYAQAQWHMFCLDEEIQSVHYLSFRKSDSHFVVVFRNNEYIKKMKWHALEFLRMLDDLEEPALIDADYENVSSNVELQNLVNQYKESQKLSKYYADLSESTKKDIILLSKDRNVRGADWKLTKSARKGNINCDLLCKAFNILDEEKEKYRNVSTTTYRIT